MPRKEPVKGYRLNKWFTHHEPKKTIKGALTYWLQKVHSGDGREALFRNAKSPIEALAGIGFFNLLQQRTASVPRRYRGWCMDGTAKKPAKLALMADEYHMEYRDAKRLMDLLIKCKWVSYLNFSDSRNQLTEERDPDENPTGIQKSPYTTNTTTTMKTTTTTRDVDDDSLALRVDPQLTDILVRDVGLTDTQASQVINQNRKLTAELIHEHFAIAKDKHRRGEIHNNIQAYMYRALAENWPIQGPVDDPVLEKLKRENAEGEAYIKQLRAEEAAHAERKATNQGRA